LSDIRIETLVGNILGSVSVPPPGIFKKIIKKNEYILEN
jgi:hypothetical protein